MDPCAGTEVIEVIQVVTASYVGVACTMQCSLCNKHNENGGFPDKSSVVFSISNICAHMNSYSPAYKQKEIQ
jgi:hypothetical protein